MNSRIEFGGLQAGLPWMTFIGEPRIVLHLLLKLDYGVQDCLRGWRTSGNIDINGNDFVDALHHVIGAIKSSASGARAHRDDPFRLGHLIINLFENRPHLVVNRAEHH